MACPRPPRAPPELRDAALAQAAQGPCQGSQPGAPRPRLCAPKSPARPCLRARRAGRWWEPSPWRGGTAGFPAGARARLFDSPPCRVCARIVTLTVLACSAWPAPSPSLAAAALLSPFTWLAAGAPASPSAAASRRRSPSAERLEAAGRLCCAGALTL